MVGLSKIPNLESLSPLVFRVLGCNPGPMTLQGTNTYLVGSGKKKILIDTGESDVVDYVTNLKDALKHNLNGAEISAVICTHWHLDHVGGTENVLRDVILKQTSNKKAEFLKFPRQDNRKEVFQPSCGFNYFKDGDVFKTDGATLKVIYTPGHADDHVSLYLEEENSIFSGDCILGEGTAVFEDFYSYMKSLEILRRFKPSRIYPGHGPVIENGQEKIDMYISHRLTREMQIIDALKTKDGKPLTAAEIVNVVYKDLNENLHKAAENNVMHHLNKLEKENRARKCGDKWTLIHGKL